MTTPTSIAKRTERLTAPLLHVHIPDDAPGLPRLLRTWAHDEHITIHNEGDSYKVWGERGEPNEPWHVIVEVDSDRAGPLVKTAAQAGVPVDVTLAYDWSLGVNIPHDGPTWATRYPDELQM